MKNNILTILVLAMTFISLPVFSQTEGEEKELGLPGDNLSLYAVLDLFQKSKTIEDFEKDLNLEKTGINNLDLDLDGKVDFIKVETKQKDDDFTFILQVAVSEKETQDVAVILVSKDDKGEVTMQIVGDKDLYGKDYIIEPKAKSATANPGYTGDDPVPAGTTTTTQTVVVQSAPIVQYVYSPVYVPYYPPYYYGYYPPYYAAFSVMAVGIYYSNHSYYHHGGYGYGNTTVIINHNNYNNYNGNRHYSNTVANNNANGNYKNNSATTRPSTGASASTRPSTGTSARPSTGTSATTRPSTGTSAKPSTGTSATTRPSSGSSATYKPSTTPSTRPSTGSSATAKPSTSPAARPSTSSSSMGASRNMSSGGYSGASGSSGGYSGGASRGGGGGRRR